MRHKVTIYLDNGRPPIVLEGEHILLGGHGRSLEGSTIYVNPGALAIQVEPIPDNTETVVAACVKEIESQITSAWNTAASRS